MAKPVLKMHMSKGNIRAGAPLDLTGLKNRNNKRNNVPSDHSALKKQPLGRGAAITTALNASPSGKLGG